MNQLFSICLLCLVAIVARAQNRQITAPTGSPLTNNTIPYATSGFQLSSTAVQQSGRTNLLIPGYITLGNTTNRISDDGSNLTRNGVAIGGGGSGDVVGPASALDNQIARFDGATGKLIQNSQVVINDSGAFSFVPGVRQEFQPDMTTPGFSVGSVAGDPSAPANGDLWYDFTIEQLRARINGSTVSLGAGGSGGDTLWHNVANAATLTNTMQSMTFFHDVAAGDDLDINFDMYAVMNSATFNDWGNIYMVVSTNNAQLNVLTTANNTDSGVRLISGDSLFEILGIVDGANEFRVVSPSGYTGAGTLFLSDDGTYKAAGASSDNWTASGTTNSLLPGIARSYGMFATNETIFNVKNFGAVGNGSTDDSAAIQSAITAANATQGGMVMIPSGVYAIASTIEVLDKPNVRLIGVGARHGIYNSAVPTNGTVLKWTGATNLPMVKVGSTVASTTSVPGNGVEGIAFDANGIADTGLLIVSSWHGIYRDLFIMDCRTVGLDVTTIDLTSTEDTQGCEFEKISVKNTSSWGENGIGIRLGSFATGGGNTSLNVWDDISVYHLNGTGMLLGDSDSNTFINTRVNRTSGAGVGIILSGSGTLSSGHCRDNAFYFVQPTSGLTSKGTALTQPAVNNYVLYSFGNSSPTPTVETGSTLWGMSTRGSIPVNNVALMGRNAAGTDDVAIVKLNAANETEIPGIWRINGSGTIGNLCNISFSTSTGTKIGTATTQKIGFYNATPIVQPASTTDLRQALINLGFLATGGATPLDLNGGALTAATVTAGGVNVMSREFLLACSDLTTAITAGTGKAYFYTPYACTVTRVKATLDTVQTSGATFTVDINEAGVSILSTKLTIDNTEPTSITAAVPPVISDTALADNAKITIDVDGIGDGTAKGLIVEIDVTRP